MSYKDKPSGAASRALARFSMRDLIIIAAMAAIGIAIKPVATNLVHIVSTPLMIPGGALAGGLYMMWLVVAMGITGKRGSATLVGIVQAIIVIIAPVTGSHGIISLVSYTMPGIVIDIALLLIGHRVCCLPCTFLAGILANLTGTVIVNLIFFQLPLVPLLLTLVVAAFSGGLGGILSWQVLKALGKYGIGGAGHEKERKSIDSGYTVDVSARDKLLPDDAACNLDCSERGA